MKAMTEAKFLSESELASALVLLEKHRGQRDSIMLRLMLFTGARACEIVALKKHQLGDQCVTIFGAKGSNDRTIPLQADFFRELTAFTADLEAEAVLFPITTRHFRRVWDKYRGNRKKGAHALRHTFGVKFYNNNRDIHATKTAMGHVNVMNTMVYLEYVEGVAKLRNKMKGMWTKKLGDAA